MSLIIRDIRYLHPLVQQDFNDLRNRLLMDFKAGKTRTHFDVFETYRTPMRQQELFDKAIGVTGAKAWQSAHNYGFATDFVAKVDGKWSWDDKHDWKYIGEIITDYPKLFAPIQWDPGHVQHALWYEISSKLI